MNHREKHLYEFGPFRLDPAEHMLLRGGEPVALTPKAFETLVVLVARGGHLVEKDELLKEVWPDSFVEEGSLARNVHELRKALGEGPSENLYIETVPKRGYRFVAPVRDLGEEGAELILRQRIRARIITEEEEETSPEAEIERAGGKAGAALAPDGGRAAVEERAEAAGRPAAGAVSPDGRAVRRWRTALVLASGGALAPATALGVRRYFASGGETIDSVAVLPFVNAN